MDTIGSCSSTILADLLPGNGCYVDLDGTYALGFGSPGTLTRAVSLTGGTPYLLTFNLAGNQRRDGTDIVDVIFGTSTLQLTRNRFDPFESFSLSFTPALDGSYLLSFLNQGADLEGALLDNVVINTRNGTPVDVPGPLPLFGAATAWVVSRRFRLRVAAGQARSFGTDPAN